MQETFRWFKNYHNEIKIQGYRLNSHVVVVVVEEVGGRKTDWGFGVFFFNFFQQITNTLKNLVTYMLQT